jgi:thiol-activated cytolysin
VPLGSTKDEIVETWDSTDGGYRFTFEKHDAIKNMENVAYLGLNDDVIWPGSMVRGDRAYDWIYEPISIARAPITLSLSLEGAGFGASTVVDNPTLSSVRNGVATLVNQVFAQNVSVPAQVDFSYESVFSNSQMSMFVGADVSYGAGNLSTTFDWSETSTTNKVVAKYTQIYFSVDMDTPASPRSLLAEDVTAAQLQNAAPPGSLPLYVGSVKYGMMAIMMIETEYTTKHMEMALDAAYDGPGLSAEVDIGLTAGDVLSKASIRIIVYGGSTSGIGVFEGLDSFMAIIKGSTDFTEDSPGVPLLYKFRHVHDNTLALITLTSQYTLCRPLKIEQWVKVKSTIIFIDWQYDDDPFYDWRVDIDRINIVVNAFDRTGPGDAGVQINPVNEALFTLSQEAFEFTEISAPGSVELKFNTEHADFDFATIRINGNARDQDWASGDEWGYGEMLMVGGEMFAGGSLMIYSEDFTMRVVITVETINWPMPASVSRSIGG